MFEISLEAAQALYPDYKFIRALRPSAQKAAFHVKDKTGTDLCFKIISPACSVERVSREIEALMIIQHPNVVKLAGYLRELKPGRSDHYMIEEFIEGIDLEEELSDNLRWSGSYISEFFSQLCDGLAELHKHKIVHRDLKPANILMRSEDFSPVIIDFGLARLLSKPALTKTEQGAALGTPLYFAPEQWEGSKHDIDHRTDLFAVGLMLYKALTGEHAFFVENQELSELQEAVCKSQAFEDNATFKSRGGKWQLITKKLLEKERGRRPNSAEKVAQILRSLGDDE